MVAPKSEAFVLFLTWIQNFTHVDDFWSVGLDFADPKKNNNYMGKIVLVMTLTAMCILLLKQSPAFNTPSVVLLLLIMFLIHFSSSNVLSGFMFFRSFSFLDMNQELHMF